MKFIYKISKFILIFSIIFAWTFNFPPTNFGGQGWPAIPFLNFPPKIKEAPAATDGATRLYLHSSNISEESSSHSPMLPSVFPDANNTNNAENNTGGTAVATPCRDTNSLSFSVFADEEGGATTPVFRSQLYEYVEADSTYILVDQTDDNAAITVGSITNYTWTGTPCNQASECAN